MKVLEEGPGWVDWSLKLKCTGKGNGGEGCESLLEVDKDDIYQTSNRDYEGDWIYYLTTKCIVCGIETDIPEADVPIRVKRLARTRRRK